MTPAAKYLYQRNNQMEWIEECQIFCICYLSNNFSEPNQGRKKARIDWERVNELYVYQMFLRFHSIAHCGKSTWCKIDERSGNAYKTTQS